MSLQGPIYFKDWLPDQPDLGNPGLTDAHNVVSIDGVYKSFRQLTASGNSLAGRPVGAIQVSPPASSSVYVYAGTQTRLYRQLTALGSWTDLSASTFNASTDNWEWAQFDDQIIATNYLDGPQRQTIGSGSNFTALSTTDTAPKAKRIGKIGRFVILGDTNDTVNGAIDYRIQWPVIDQPTNWATPNSATAIAGQAGEQFFDPIFGPVQAIVGGDQFGVIFQARGLTRATYAGGDTVFQFDKISSGFGLLYPKSVVQWGGKWLYIGDAGVLATDGVGIERIGLGKVDRYIENHFLGNPNRVYSSYDQERNLIYWCARANASAGTGEPDFVLIYNPADQRFTYGDQACECLFQGNEPQLSNAMGFNASYAVARFAGIAGSLGSAVFTSGEMELVPGKYARVKSVKPLIDATGITVALGTRNDRTSAVSYTSEITPTTRTGLADFRSEARYHRARMTISGTVNSAQGLEFDAALSGDT